MSGYVLVHLAGVDADTDLMRAALAVGRRLNSHVRGLHIRFDAAAVAGITAPGMSATMYEQMIDQANRESEDRAQAAREAFEGVTAGVARAQAPVDGLSVGWTEASSAGGTALAAHAQGANSVVLARPRDRQDVHAALAIEAVLFGAARPVIVVPPDAPTEWGQCAMLAWNGSAQSARAMFDALPLLRLADRVIVVAAPAAGSEVSANDAVGHLAWQGVPSTAVTLDGTGPELSARLFAAVADHHCDLVVMGGYGHSRMREFILGGVTRHALYESKVPLLLSH